MKVEKIHFRFSLYRIETGVFYNLNCLISVIILSTLYKIKNLYLQKWLWWNASITFGSCTEKYWKKVIVGRVKFGKWINLWHFHGKSTKMCRIFYLNLIQIFKINKYMWLLVGTPILNTAYLFTKHVIRLRLTLSA